MRSRLVVAVLALSALVEIPPARGSDPSTCEAGLRARDLRRMTPCELDDLFAHGTANCVPVGVLRGRVLYVVAATCPRLRAGLQSTLWKGKVFHADGDFTNRWCGFRAGTSHVQIGSSWFDGQPCIVLEYPPDALVFANARDELREIAAGLYLGRVYDRCPCPKLTGYFVLERTCRQ
jgi:hypothetical protein